MLSHWVPPDASEKKMASEINAMADMKEREEKILPLVLIVSLMMNGTNIRTLVIKTGEQMKTRYH